MKKYNIALYILAFIKLALPFFLQSSYYQPHRDEFLYLAEGNHMAWGFMEVPPLLSVFAWLTHLFGDSMFWIKFWPSLIGALTFVVAGRLVIHMGGKVFAFCLCFLGFTMTGYLRVHFLFQPNFLEVFFWTMIAYGIIRYIQTNKNSWLYITGISAGLGMMSKYSALFFIVAVLAGLLLTPQRKIFANKHLYIAAAIGFIIFLPNVIWQYTRHFPVLHHMQELNETQLQYVSPKAFLTDQLVMFLPCVFIWVAGLLFVAFSPKAKSYRFMAWAYLFVIAMLLYLHGKGYYSIGAYPLLFAFGACWLEQLTGTRTIWPGYILRFIFIAIPLIFIRQFIPIALPIFEPDRLAAFYPTTFAKQTGTLRWEDLKDHPLPQDFADMLGWEEMGQKAAAAWHSLDSNQQKHTIIFCDNYGQAGAVTFYAKKYHMPEAGSTNASFLYWMPDSIHVDNLLLVTDDVNEMKHDWIKDFKSAIVTDSVTSKYAREHGDLIILFKGADDAFNQMFKKKLADARAVFTKENKQRDIDVR